VGVEPVRSEGSFLAGDQSGDRGQDRVEVLASAEVTGPSPPVLRVADAVLDADPLRRVGPGVRPHAPRQLSQHFPGQPPPSAIGDSGDGSGSGSAGQSP
jgi:hypothetical protein